MSSIRTESRPKADPTNNASAGDTGVLAEGRFLLRLAALPTLPVLCRGFKYKASMKCSPDTEGELNLEPERVPEVSNKEKEAARHSREDQRHST